MNWVLWIAIGAALLAIAVWLVYSRIQLNDRRFAEGMDALTLAQRFINGRHYHVSGFGVLEAAVDDSRQRRLVILKKPGTEGGPEDTVLVVNARGTIIGPDAKPIALKPSDFRPVD